MIVNEQRAKALRKRVLGQNKFYSNARARMRNERRAPLNVVRSYCGLQCVGELLSYERPLYRALVVTKLRVQDLQDLSVGL